MNEILVIKPYGWWRPGDRCKVLNVLDGGKTYQVIANKGGPVVQLHKSFVRKIL